MILSKLWTTFSFGLTLLLLATQGAAQQEEVTYYHFDALGSPVLATDESGAVKWREEYAPYGGRLLEESRELDCSVTPCEATNSPWENRQFYTGKYDEADTELTYFGARWYDPSLGRFLSVDPVEFHEENIFLFNRYAYANNNPYMYVDPDGRVPLLAIPVLITGIGYLITPNIANAPTFDSVDERTTVLDAIPASLGGGAAGIGVKTLGKNVVKGGLGNNPFKNKTPKQIEKMFKDKGFEPRGPDPLSGKGGYVNPKTERSYHIDPGRQYKKGTELPHVDVNRKNRSKLPKKKYPLGERLNDGR